MTETGTIISGTLRNEDIAPALLDYLVGMGKNGIVPLTKWAALDKTAKEAHANIDRMSDAEGWDTEEGTEFVCELFDIINDLLPEGYYCGSLEGDGADVGIWEELEEGIETSFADCHSMY